MGHHTWKILAIMNKAAILKTLGSRPASIQTPLRFPMSFQVEGTVPIENHKAHPSPTTTVTHLFRAA
jgi:hypothetical protein